MNERKGKSKKKWIVLGTVAAALAVLMASTYLWFSASDEIENVFEMDVFDVVITENYEPEPVTPGAEINKDIGVENKSSIPVAVRMQLQESLQLLDIDSATGNPKIEYNKETTLTDKQIMVTVSQNQVDHLVGTNGQAGSGYVENTGAGAPTGVKLYERVTQVQGGTKTEYFAYETTTMRLVKYDPAATDKFTYAYYTQKTPILKGIHGTAGEAIDHDQIELIMGEDYEDFWKLDPTSGWFYYKTLLGKGDTSEYLVSAVKFAEDLDNEFKGAIYTLTPVMSAIQGKDAALKEVWNDITPEGRVAIDEDNSKLVFTGF